MKKILLILFAVGATALAHEPNPKLPEEFEHVQSQKSREVAGPILSKLLLKGPSAEGYAQLASVFFDDSQPLPARFFYEMAIGLDSENKAYQESYQKVVDQVAYLDQRFLHFVNLSQKEDKVTHFASMATIKFHMGFRAEGLQVLRDAIRVHGEDQRIFPLIGTFKHQIMADRQTVQLLNSDLDQAILRGEVEKAAGIAGQMFFVTGGHPEMLSIIKRVNTIPGAKVHDESLAILEVLTQQHPQAVAKEG
ncbi:hypothetical protein [Acanthopleuribacter pedis]|uniref:Uncharacterized protein n=1 Tax=Acanthopleuribacter pedis TaxID=442870 RepID=A0A8J7U151_9BACT|nr:hypothetical protein [Acanthopleuribacter pedis]MBO1317177.1 hypothetical protein [Acanthopleuribacter pedis]